MLYLLLPLVALCAPFQDSGPPDRSGSAAAVTPEPGGGRPAVDALAVYARYRELAEQPLWPGFAPLEVPVAIYDGARTVLFGHPAPPAEFSPIDAFPGVHWLEGSHDSVRANTSTDLAGTRTATLMVAGNAEGPQRPASILIHEAFHVFQELAHPDWPANEAALFDYPVENSEVLTLRRLEVEALRRALEALSPSATRGWTGRALEYRAERHQQLRADARDYERAIERHEGLARYVEERCLDTALDTLPPEGFAAEEIRRRGYGTGAAMARLLDRIARGWQAEFHGLDDGHLDAHLRKLLGPPEPGTELPDFSEEERTAIADQAVLDAARLRIRLQDARQAFSEREGWSVEIHAPPAAPLFPQGFDPLNVRRLSPLEVLHDRWVKLGNLKAQVEVLNTQALTYGAGEHPLFQGVSRLLVTGFPEEPTVTQDGGSVRILADGLEASFDGAEARRDGQRWTVELGG